MFKLLLVLVTITLVTGYPFAYPDDLPPVYIQQELPPSVYIEPENPPPVYIQPEHPPPVYIQPEHAPPSYPQPQPKYTEEPKKPYAFDYGVKDDYSGTNFNHAENSDGDSVTGSYNVVLPDGRIQTVNYVADHYNGFQAQVSYEGVAQYPEAKPYVQQPSYRAPPQPSYPVEPQEPVYPVEVPPPPPTYPVEPPPQNYIK